MRDILRMFGSGLPDPRGLGAGIGRGGDRRKLAYRYGHTINVLRTGPSSLRATYVPVPFGSPFRFLYVPVPFGSCFDFVIDKALFMKFTPLLCAFALLADIKRQHSSCYSVRGIIER